MSGTPKYSRVDLTAARAAEARRRVEAERQKRAEEAAKRQAALEAERERRLALARDVAARQRRQLDERSRQQAAARERAVAASPVGDRRAVRVQRRRGAEQATAPEVAPLDPAAEPALVTDAEVPAADLAAPAVAPPADRADPPVAERPVAEPPVAEPIADDDPAIPVNPVSPELVRRGLQLRGAAAALLAAAGSPPHAAVFERLARADAALGSVLDATDEGAVQTALAEASDAYDAARSAHEARVELRVRRRMIATAIVEALPDRYVVDARPAEDADGTIRFTAAAPHEELRVTVTGDASIGDVIGYQSEGVAFKTRVEDGDVVSDCPSLSAALEAVHTRLAPMGVLAGPLTWRDAPAQDRQRSHRATRRNRGETR